MQTIIICFHFQLYLQFLLLFSASLNCPCSKHFWKSQKIETMLKCLSLHCRFGLLIRVSHEWQMIKIPAPLYFPKCVGSWFLSNCEVVRWWGCIKAGVSSDSQGCVSHGETEVSPSQWHHPSQQKISIFWWTAASSPHIDMSMVTILISDSRSVPRMDVAHIAVSEQAVSGLMKETSAWWYLLILYRHFRR